MNTPARSFAFAPLLNDPPGAANPQGNDATGTFQPGMQRFRDCHSAAGGIVLTHLFQNHGRARAQRQDVIAALEVAGAGGRLDAIAYFGHGWHTSLPSAGFGLGDIEALGEAIIRLCNPGAKIIVYACHTAVPGGFAYQLGRRLGAWAQHGTEVFGHPIEGHSFRNPMVRRSPHHAARPATRWRRPASSRPGGGAWLTPRCGRVSPS